MTYPTSIDTPERVPGTASMPADPPGLTGKRFRFLVAVNSECGEVE